MGTLFAAAILAGFIVGYGTAVLWYRHKAKLNAFDEWTQTPIASKLARDMTMQYLIKLDENV